MIRIDAIQPDSVPVSFPGANSERPKADSTSTGGGNRAGNSPTPGNGDTVTLSAEALAALATLSAEASNGPEALGNAPPLPLPSDIYAPDADATDSSAIPTPADQLSPSIADATQNGMDAAPMGIREDIPNLAIRGQAYERIQMSAPDRAAPAGTTPDIGQTDSAAIDMTENGALANATQKAMTERLLDSGLAEDLAAHLLDGRPTDRTGNRPRTARTDIDPAGAGIARDLSESLAPDSIAPNTPHMPAVDERMVAMYAPPMGNHAIREPMPETNDEDPLPAPSGRVTGALLDALAAWQGRRLNALYPVIFFDTLRVKIRDDSIMRDKPVHVARGMRLDGTLDLLGLWLERHETTGFGRHVMDALKRRGVEDILMAVVDEPERFPQAIHAAFPEAQIHPSIAHLLRHLPDIVALADRASTAGKAAVAAIAESPWGRMLQSATHDLRQSNMILDRAIQARGYFPNDQAALAFLFLIANTEGKAAS